MDGSNNGMLVLDDRNPGIVYSAGWGLDWDPVAAYNSTLHLAGAQGLSASLKYVGTQVIVKGCVGQAPDHAASQVLATYSVDGQSYGTTNVDDPAVSSSTLQFCNATLFASPTLPHGQHRLEVTINNIAPNELWIDYFSYIPTDASGVTQVLHSTTTADEPSGHTATAAGSPSHTATSEDSQSPMSTTGGALGSTAMSGETPGRTATAGETLGIATSSISGSSPSGPPHPHSTGAIIGGSAAAAVIVVLLAILGATLSLRRRLTQSRRDSTGDLRLLASRSSSQCTFATDIVSPISATNTFPEKAYIRSVTTTSALDATSCMPSLPSPTTHLPAPESQRQSVVQADQRDGSASIPPGLGQRSRAPSIRTTDRPVSFALSLNPPYTWKDWPVETGSGQGGVMRNVTTPDMTDSEARSSVVRYSSLTSGPPSYTSLPSP